MNCSRKHEEGIEIQDSEQTESQLDLGKVSAFSVDARNKSKSRDDCLNIILFQFLEVCGFIVCCTCLGFAVVYEECYDGYICFRNCMVGSFLSGVSFVILVLIHKDKFTPLVDWLQSQSICCVKLRSLIVSLFLLIGFVDFLLLSISAACPEGDDCDEPLLDPEAGNGEIQHITRTLTALSAILFAFTILSHWDHFSYLCAHYAWIHAFLYCTVVGGIILHAARYLIPPKKTSDQDWSWHAKHRTSKILDRIMLIALGLVIMFVWLSAISVALLTQASNESWVLGAWWVQSIYCILALILGVSPVAPGSVADTLGGFLLVNIYRNMGYSFFEAIVIAMAYVTVLHFVASCFQYVIGSFNFLKAWANFSLPPDMLAASDSVLLDASCVTVGIVGQVFMDTLSGFNQGRMGMNCCTQFWSEYASLPTGWSWVAFGAVLSVQGVPEYDWAPQVLPMCLLMAATWQFLGTTFGAYKIVKASSDQMFWKNQEKWETVQYFHKKGVRATKEGWEHDCFCLHGMQGKGMKVARMESLFEKIKPIQGEYAKYILSSARTVKDQKVTEKSYNKDRSSVRNKHWDDLLSMYFEKERKDDILQVKEQHKDKNYFVASKPLNDLTGQNSWREGTQWFLVLVASILGLYSYLSIGRMVETAAAVQEGLTVLEDVSFLQWVAFCVYNFVILVYYYQLLINKIKSGCDFILRFITCKWCRTPDFRLETTFAIEVEVLKSDNPKDATFA